MVDDHEIVRRGIRAVLGTKRDIVVVGEAADGEEAIAQARELAPDVVLMDIMMPGVDGIAATRAIAGLDGAPRILVLTSFASDEQVFPAIKAGALGYLLKDTGPEELVQAIRQTHRGEPTLDTEVARKVLGEIAGASRKPLSSDPLTTREMDVLRLVAQGRSNREIAERLCVSEDTIHTHVGNILGKLHLASRTQAALYALKEGFASLDDIPGHDG
ncbi:MAG TPA: response regulator transcription factor [Spirochaetia bacterium]